MLKSILEGLSVRYWKYSKDTRMFPSVNEILHKWLANPHENIYNYSRRVAAHIGYGQPPARMTFYCTDEFTNVGLPEVL